MDVSEVIAKRRSVRTYKKQDLPQGTVEKLLEAGKEGAVRRKRSALRIRRFEHTKR